MAQGDGAIVMQKYLVVIILFLYAAFAFDPIAEMTLFSRNLALSPGEVLTILMVLTMTIKALIQRQKVAIKVRPRDLSEFLGAYIFLAFVFLLTTLLFFFVRNEFADFLPRSLFIYLKWLIALVLIYFASGTSLRINGLHQITLSIMFFFLVGAIRNVFSTMPDTDLVDLLINTLASTEARFGGQSADPNELGTLAAFFVVLGAMGILNAKKKWPVSVFFLLTAGNGFILVLTQSREALLTAFIAFGAIFYLLLRSKKYIKAIIVLCGIMIGSTLALLNVPRIAETFADMEIGSVGTALSQRDVVWSTAIEIIISNPWGIGFENMYYLTDNLIGQAHNSFLQATLIAGIVGFFAFIYFLFALCRMIIKQSRVVTSNWLLDAYIVFIFGYLFTAMGSDHFISFFIFNAIFFGLLGFVVAAR